MPVTVWYTQPSRSGPYRPKIMILRRRDLTFQTRRGQIVARFVTGANASEPEVDRWLGLWDRQAKLTGIGRDSPGYWGAGLRWIARQRAAGAPASEEA
jgi:hypothetical protein